MSIKEFNMDIKELSRIQDMANLYKEDTGVDARIWVSTKYENHKIPRATVLIKGECVSIAITEEPWILAPKNCKHVSWYKKAMEWIKKNRELLLKYWNDNTFSTRVFLNSIEKV